MSQILLIVYFWLDNGAMTCGLDFEFCSESDTESETTMDCKTKSLITGEEQISDETFVDLRSSTSALSTWFLSKGGDVFIVTFQYRLKSVERLLK